MIEINLIPDVKQELLKAERSRAMVISGAIITCIVAGGIVALLAVYVYGFQGARNLFADNAIKSGSEELAKVEDLSKMLTVQNQIKQINELDKTKTVDSRLFDVLSAVIPPAPTKCLFHCSRSTQKIQSFSSKVKRKPTTLWRYLKRPSTAQLLSTPKMVKSDR